MKRVHNKKICKLCDQYLGGFELPIPERCVMCTDMVKWTIERMHEYWLSQQEVLTEIPATEEDLWNG